MDDPHWITAFSQRTNHYYAASKTDMKGPVSNFDFARPTAFSVSKECRKIIRFSTFSVFFVHFIGNLSILLEIPCSIGVGSFIRLRRQNVCSARWRQLDDRRCLAERERACEKPRGSLRATSETPRKRRSPRPRMRCTWRDPSDPCRSPWRTGSQQCTRSRDSAASPADRPCVGQRRAGRPV
jgi:hypothetical protein